MDGTSDWTQHGEINSERDLIEGEKPNVVLLDTVTGEVLERIAFAPLPERLGRYTWPKFFADHINANAVSLRAGIRQTDGTFKTEYSSYLNKLWVTSVKGRVVLTTACYFNDWSDLYAINAVGSLPEGSSITCRLASKTPDSVYETVRCEPPKEQTGRYSWPAYVSHAVNGAGGLLRAGEKDEARQVFTPLGSSYRNHLWAPMGMPLIADLQVSVCADALASAAEVFERLCAQVLKPIPEPEEIDGWLTGFSDGKFLDITYPLAGSTVNDVSGLTLHLDRIWLIASYTFTQTAQPSATYLASALEALNFYVTQNYNIASWWSEQIGLAKQAGRAAVLLARHLRTGKLMEHFIPYAMKTTNTYAYTETGANLADFASVQIIWSVCAWKNSGKDEYLLYLRASADVLSELCYPVQRDGKEYGEGVRVDYSISQHNPQRGDTYYSQLYSGSYGGELLGRIFDNLAVLNGAFALASTALGHLARVVIDGLGWMGYSQRLDFHINGRAISRGVASNVRFAGWAEALIPLVGDSDRKALVELIRRVNGDEVRNEHYQGGRLFWVNDYLAHIGRDFCLWAKAVSTRTVGGESGNGENPKGYYMGAGSYFLTRHGGEYEGIQPVWDWQRLPGTTVEQVPNFKWPDITWGANMWGSHAFAGGVSDGTVSLLSMVLSRRNVTHACKTVMTFDDRVVCIGTRIDSPSATHSVLTSVNQCIAKGPVSYVKADGEEHIVPAGQAFNVSDVRKVYHDGLVYEFGSYFLRPSVTLEVKACSGAWSDINVNGSHDSVTLMVFSLWINHAHGEQGHYLYTISPAEALSDVATLVAPRAPWPDYHVWGYGNVTIGSYFGEDGNSNSAGMRSIPRSAGEGEQTFYPLQPCAFICEPVGTQLHLTCSDPTQTLEKLSFVVSADESGTALKTIEVLLPQGEDKGRSVSGIYPTV
ncbi:polysaccharide lyase family 8 super-sandwich domain-containing protein [Pseudomonas sp. CDFA 610]|uniref:polysaccharide lyase family 8 super-sandwich domain-containing protein n=1 Tax=Pseudomonas sp. CDFA 610 TaxID=2829825 RepID=UPI001E4BFE40|nr:polysaccharide lyase family 8 super-sandwich domain-containing protein [Pseudomonas sp. CDFA 610]MCD5982095.1 silent information regulator protein Sir2 [Pseudomonas sp. CDFA 610]